MRSIALGALAFVLAASVARAEDPDLRKALEQLQQARQVLQQAPASRSGHRARALDYLDDAIKHVREGLAFTEQGR
jgi:hypothetical protein